MNAKKSDVSGDACIVESRRGRTVILACLVSMMLANGRIVARPLVRLSYEDLLGRSDVVVVGRVQKTADDEKRRVDDALQSQRDNVIPVLSTIRVEAVMKGRDVETTINIAHWRFKDGIVVNNGPRLVKFMIRGEKTGVSLSGRPVYAEEPPSYLLFLKKSPEGLFIPVTGQFDPDDSVRRLAPAERDHPIPPTDEPVR
jgi:hypothetical protein